MIAVAVTEDKQVEMKCSMADLVTETDQMVEKMIISTLKEHFPTHCFIGEESVAAGEKCVLTDAPTWVIDPVDGTNNFVHTFPFVAVSIALMINKQAEIGIVYNPLLKEMYSARKGQGAFCNGKKLKCSSVKDLGQALVATEFGSQRDPEILDKKFRNMRSIIEKAHG
ncbi:hypothetical protein CAPTEDRAFT_159956 [Capitella teleta]|uniref:Inositol-1-monophosphatase n=1 Tax=Capitella teleta TaxID=283909 RepID=R7UDC7_CAPTE|nr:hypothetical protein CAPTEDRAFT_159956 [Capitella teleta]|eukprot:ELU03964.1 hypothetical protein CAPTEDRAFT_159956 [Capitella teleta]